MPSSVEDPLRDLAPQVLDTLIVQSMCCHPALTPGSAIALTLRAVGGLTTAQIASAFLVPEATWLSASPGRSSGSRLPVSRSGCRRVTS